MAGQRELARTRIHRDVQIFISENAPIITCVVRDLTNKGALLSVPAMLPLPVKFELSFDSCRSMRQCRIVWRSHDEVGVAFVSRE